MATRLTSGQVSQYVLFGVVIGVCAPVFIRNAYYFNHGTTPRYIKFLKCSMALFMALKTCLFIALSVPNGASCEALGRSADIFYHISMMSGDAVLMGRIYSVVTPHWKRRIFVLHCFILFVRLVVAVVDTSLVHITYDPQVDSCDYRDSHVVGVVYTSMDTLVDFYATCMICLILVRHMRKLSRDGLVTANAHRYVSIALYNCTRTALLTIVNLISAVGIGSKLGNSYFIPLVNTLWPITNLLFVALIGYDTDFTKVIKNMRSQFQDNKSTTIFDVALPPPFDLSARNSDIPLTTTSTSQSPRIDTVDR